MSPSLGTPSPGSSAGWTRCRPEEDASQLRSFLGEGNGSFVPERAQLAFPREAVSHRGCRRVIPPYLAGMVQKAKPALKESVQDTSTVNNSSNVYTGYRFLPVLQIFVHCKA